MKILNIIGEILRQIVTVAINIYIYRKYGNTFMFYLSIILTLSITRKILLYISSLFLSYFGLSIGYISFWHRTIEDILLLIKLKKYNILIYINRIILFPSIKLFPIPFLIDGIKIEIDEKEFKKFNIKKPMDNIKKMSEKSPKKIKFSFFTTSVISSLIKLILSCFSITIKDVTITFYQLCGIKAFSFTFGEFSYIALNNNTYKTREYTIKLSDLYFYSRERLYSESIPDLLIPSIKIIVGSSYYPLGKVAEYIEIDFGDGFQFSLSEQLLRLKLLFTDKKTEENKIKDDDKEGEEDNQPAFTPKELSDTPSDNSIQEIDTPSTSFYTFFLSIFKQIPDINITFRNLTFILSTTDFDFPISFSGSIVTNIDYNSELGTDDGKMKIEFDLYEFTLNDSITLQGLTLSSLLSFSSSIKDLDNKSIFYDFIHSFVSNTICTASLDYIHIVLTTELLRTLYQISTDIKKILPAKKKKQKIVIKKTKKHSVDIFGLLYSTSFTLQFSLGSFVLDVSPELESCPLFNFKLLNLTITLPLLFNSDNNKCEESYNTIKSVYIKPSIFCDSISVDLLEESMNQSLKDEYINGRLLYIPDIHLDIKYTHINIKEEEDDIDNALIEFGFRTMYLLIDQQMFNKFIFIGDKFISIVKEIKLILPKNKSPLTVVNKTKKLNIDVDIKLKLINLRISELYNKNDNLYLSIKSINVMFTHESILQLNLDDFIVNSNPSIDPPIVLIENLSIEKSDIIDIKISRPEMHISFGILYILINFTKSLMKKVKEIFKPLITPKPPKPKVQRVSIFSLIPVSHLEVSIKNLKIYFMFSHSYWIFGNENGIIQFDKSRLYDFSLEIANFTWHISTQELPFLLLPYGILIYNIPLNYVPVHSNNLISLPHITINTKEILLLLEDNTQFGDILGDFLVQMKTFKTLLKGHAYIYRYSGNDDEEHESMIQVQKVDMSKAFIIEVTCSYFEFLVNEDVKTTTNINNTNRLCSIVGETLYLLTYWHPDEHDRVHLIDKIHDLDDGPVDILKNGGYGDVYGIKIERLNGFNFGVFIRDYPLPIVELTSIEISGFFAIGDIAAVNCSIIEANSSLSSNIYYLPIPQNIYRSLESTKIYFDCNLDCFTLNIAYGTCLGQALTKMSDSFGKMTPDALDTVSPKLPWWDKMRYLIHGKFEGHVHDYLVFCWYNSNPYDDNYLEIILNNASLEYTEPRVFLVEFDSAKAMISGIERDPKTFLYATHIVVTLSVNWTTYGDPLDHHIFLNLPNNIDKYNNFRSLAINWTVDIFVRAPDSISQTHGFILYFQWIDYITWLKSFVYKIMNNPSTSLSLGVLTTNLELIFTAENPIMIWWLENDSIESFIPRGDIIKVRLIMHKNILTPDLLYPVFGCESQYQILSLCIELEKVRIDVCKRMLKPIAKEHPFLIEQTNDTFMATINKLLLLMGTEETQYKNYLDSIKMNENVLEDSNPPYVVVNQFKFLWTVPMKRFAFKVKDDIFNLLFSQVNPLTENTILIEEGFRKKQHLLVTSIQNSFLSNKNDEINDVDESFFMMIGKQKTAVESPPIHISMVCILIEMQLNCMSMDSNYTSVVLTAQQVSLVRSYHIGDKNQQVSKTLIHMANFNIYIFPHDYERKIIFVNEGDKGTSLQVLNDTDLEVTMVYNPSPPQSVNHMDPIIDSDEINKLIVNCSFLDFNANGLQFSEALEAFQNVILFSFSNNTTLPLAHKAGASHLRKDRIEELLQSVTAIMKDYNDEKYVTYLMHINVKGGKWTLNDASTGKSFGIFSFNDLEMSRFTYNDLSQLTTVNCSKLELVMKVGERKNFKSILSSKIIDYNDVNSPMLSVRTETGSPIIVDDWPINVYFHIEINIFPCSRNRIVLNVRSNIFKLIHDYFFPIDSEKENENEKENEKNELLSHVHVFTLQRDPANATIACCICNKIVNGMRNVEWQCQECGCYAHTVCKDNTELEGDLSFINHFRFGDLKTTISVRTSRFNLDSWDAVLKQVTLSRNLSTFSGLFHKIKIHYTSEALRLAPTLVMKKLKKDKKKKEKESTSILNVIRHRTKKNRDHEDSLGSL